MLEKWLGFSRLSNTHYIVDMVVHTRCVSPKDYKEMGRALGGG